MKTNEKRFSDGKSFPSRTRIAESENIFPPAFDGDGGREESLQEKFYAFREIERMSWMCRLKGSFEAVKWNCFKFLKEKKENFNWKVFGQGNL